MILFISNEAERILGELLLFTNINIQYLMFNTVECNKQQKNQCVSTAKMQICL